MSFFSLNERVKSIIYCACVKSTHLNEHIKSVVSFDISQHNEINISWICNWLNTIPSRTLCFSSLSFMHASLKFNSRAMHKINALIRQRIEKQSIKTMHLGLSNNNIIII